MELYIHVMTSFTRKSDILQQVLWGDRRENDSWDRPFHPLHLLQETLESELAVQL